MQYPMNQQMPYNSPLTRPVYGSQQNWGNRIRPVSSLDEVKASTAKKATKTAAKKTSAKKAADKE